MPEAASPEDLRELLRHRRNDVTTALGREAAEIQSKASLNGMLGSGRLGLLYIEAAERAWRGLVDDALTDLRSFTQATGLAADDLSPVAREELSDALPILREASKFDGAAGSRFRESGAASDAYEQAWAKLPSYLDRRMRQFELGMHDQPQPQRPSVTYAIHATTISGPIQQGTQHSSQTVVVSGDTLLTKLEATIQTEVADEHDREQLLALVKELNESKGTAGFLGTYQRFMSAASDHVTVLAPFLPALAQMISQ